MFITLIIIKIINFPHLVLPVGIEALPLFFERTEKRCDGEKRELTGA